MARKRNRAPEIDPAVEQAIQPAKRLAVPSRSLLDLNVPNAMLASVGSTAAVFAAAPFNPAIGAGAAAVFTAGVGMRMRGRTLSQWVRLRRSRQAAPQKAMLVSRDNVGIVFDGVSATAMVEITPRPWQITTVGPTGISEAPQISADVLRQQLIRHGISVSSLDVINIGYKFARPRRVAKGAGGTQTSGSADTAADVLDAMIGPVSVPLGGSTAIAVTIDLDGDAIGAAYARAVPNELPLPSGFCQTLIVAAKRVRNALAEQGFGGHLMSSQQVLDFDETVRAQLARSLEAPGWAMCGNSAGIHTRTYVPAAGHWTSESAGAWNHLQAHRQYTTLTLTPRPDGAAFAQPLMTYLVQSGEALAKASSYGLRSASGQQAAGIARALPVSERGPLLTTGAVIDDNHHLGFGIAAGGAGMFIGSRADKTRLFVAVSPAAEPLWLSGPTLFAMQMVARLSTQDLQIAVMIDDPLWQELVDHRAIPTLTLGGLDRVRADVIVCTPQWWERNRTAAAGKAVLLVTEAPAPQSSSNALEVQTADGVSEISIRADEEQHRVLWELPPMERRALLGGIDPSGASAAPREGAALRLGQVANFDDMRENGQAAVLPPISSMLPPQAPIELPEPITPEAPSGPSEVPVGGVAAPLSPIAFGEARDAVDVDAAAEPALPTFEDSGAVLIPGAAPGWTAEDESAESPADLAPVLPAEDLAGEAVPGAPVARWFPADDLPTEVLEPVAVSDDDLPTEVIPAIVEDEEPRGRHHLPGEDDAK
ncbi:type VII secretion protein EccE (plasmid) [Tsukamurella tyrosinosolvens]|uniref:Type VII secretion protein EccE n=1 Tax=Tsukamurella tyrosinosolvens TaxID=57704 RepID=A0A1H4VIH3_TSUTY|nr:hypothetical protein [Tsukamurella tyrosinosolvens]KXO90962.1 hypothetical protein AXK58_21255 [Tsukamurella tyrosinosolvens]SEC80909.1 type VII secretion protein EccE [Tsukamurella tyrosinosolvens]VEH90489.1 type VII secretion protein EccE [Tsukamurella tyrosinosolvens]